MDIRAQQQQRRPRMCGLQLGPHVSSSTPLRLCKHVQPQQQQHVHRQEQKQHSNLRSNHHNHDQPQAPMDFRGQQQRRQQQPRMCGLQLGQHISSSAPLRLCKHVQQQQQQQQHVHRQEQKQHSNHRSNQHHHDQPQTLIGLKYHAYATQFHNSTIKNSLNAAKSQQQASKLTIKKDASTNTELSMDDIVTRVELNDMMTNMQKLLDTVVNLSDNAGNTAMHYAASHARLDIIEVLLGTKVCDVNCRNKAGYTPIMLLALAEISEPQDQEIARDLFTMGDVNIQSRSSGQTALMLAASHGRLATCKLLLECGADPSLQDYDGSTALMCGSEIGNEAVVKCLLTHKLTDPTITDNDGLDALTIAMNNGHKNIGLILYTATNVPKMVRPCMSLNGNTMFNTSGSYLSASLRRSRAKLATTYLKKADSLLGSRSARPIK